MHLHHLTRADIELFTMATFEKESNFDNKDEKSRDIVQEIVDGADGVFLWVRLVVRSLLNGFRHRYPVAHLKQELENMPRELDILFDKIFNSIDSGDREQSDKMLLSAATYPISTSLCSRGLMILRKTFPSTHLFKHTLTLRYEIDTKLCVFSWMAYAKAYWR